MTKLRVTNLVVMSKFRDISEDEQDRIVGGGVEASQVATFINGRYVSGTNFASLNANNVTVEQILRPVTGGPTISNQIAIIAGNNNSISQTT